MLGPGMGGKGAPRVVFQVHASLSPLGDPYAAIRKLD